MDHITNSLFGIIAVHNDIYIYDRNAKEHDKHLLQLMKTASFKALVFNSSKCSTQPPQITFYGAIFRAQGMKPNLS